MSQATPNINTGFPTPPLSSGGVGHSRLNPVTNVYEVWDGYSWMPLNVNIFTGKPTAHIPKLPTLGDLCPEIRAYRRLSPEDVASLSTWQPELVQNMVRNRLNVSVRADLHHALNLYAAWLDENISGLYSIEARDGKLLLSFELQADMMQFTLAFK